jgi:hypothetical protein
MLTPPLAYLCSLSLLGRGGSPRRIDAPHKCPRRNLRDKMTMRRGSPFRRLGGRGNERGQRTCPSPVSRVGWPASASESAVGAVPFVRRAVALQSRHEQSRRAMVVEIRSPGNSSGEVEVASPSVRAPRLPPAVAFSTCGQRR